MELEKILDIIQDEAKQADTRAAEACKRSKYSTQDYHICVEFYLQQLHDRLAREAGLSRRCPVFPMRERVAELRRLVARESAILGVVDPERAKHDLRDAE